MATLREIFDDPNFALLSEEDQQRFIVNNVPNLEESMSKFEEEQGKLENEKVRQFWQQRDLAALPQEGPPVPVSNFARGALNTVLPGSADATASLMGVPPSELELEAQAAPGMLSAGEISGATFPVPGLKGAKTVRGAAGQGAKLGAAYGAIGGVTDAITEGERDPFVLSGRALEGAVINSPLGALTGAGMKRLSLPPRGKGVAESAAATEKRTFEALKTGIEAQEKRGGAAPDALDAMDFSRIEKAVQRGNPIVMAERPQIQNMDEYREATHEAYNRIWKIADKRLTTAQNKGLEISGDQLALEGIKAAFPRDFFSRLSSVEQRNFDDGLKQLLILRGKDYSNPDNLVRMLLAPKGRFSSLNPQLRTELANMINNMEPGKPISGNVLFNEGLKRLYGGKLAVDDAQLTTLADDASWYLGKQLKPWEVQDRIKLINKELGPFYEMKPTPQDAASVAYTINAKESEARALRRSLNETVSKLPNEFQELKNDLGALSELSEAARVASITEKTTPQPPNWWKKLVRRSGGAQNSLAALLMAFTPDERQLTPSQRIKMASEAAKTAKRSAPMANTRLQKMVELVAPGTTRLVPNTQFEE